MGNTLPDNAWQVIVLDHPHIHGEYAVNAHNRDVDKGSPPHTWGIPALVVHRNNRTRITPTYMGNTC